MAQKKDTDTANNNFTLVNPQFETFTTVKEVIYEDALELIGFGKFQLQLLVIVSFLILTVLNETMGISIIIPAAQCDLELSSTDKGMLQAAGFVGIIISSHMWGYLGDTKGRRIVILYGLIFSTVSTIASAFASNYIFFLICRFSNGFFISAVSSTTYAYAGEFNTLKNKAAFISWMSVAVGLALIYMPMSAWLMLSYEWTFNVFGDFVFKPWRAILLIYAAPGIIGGIGLYFYPESPKFLLAQGNEDEALETLKWIYRTNKHVDNDDNFEVKKLASETDLEQQKNLSESNGCLAVLKSMWNQTIPLFKPPYAMHFFICCFLHYATFSVAGGVGLWFPDIINTLSSSEGARNASLCNVLRSKQMVNVSLNDFSSCDDTVQEQMFINSSILGTAYTVALIILSLAMKPVGRVGILLFTLLTSGTSGLALMFVSNPLHIMLLFCSFIMFCGINVCVINATAVCLFPTNLRTMSICVAMLFGRLGSAIASNLIGYLLEKNCELTFYFFGGLVIAAGMSSLGLPYK